ncbi:hypothetical protein COS31_02640 [Candidatus Roizmanbacteria bacterium CG02_land_8_20_14_3_00_36_15]|uniref:Glycosyltransferase 2-like domain-containing protein n=2 Tax=Candidatus Roizmaniibacteriota TaxID=1752723 RepID=A0A2M8KML5_9BACT|nr:MAG: hypothetical protein COS51_05290 [Candidatus Roizmanbacteria bacterium CG03_land_8_20_14_0_80_36_21]PIV37802.1 MAG: hypothetical protein COS31_02640 [Candidatus Roizmanbacteria bacterium CG02_land_8_20_14_3_00_36_15]PJA52599.1 MAG: hypothetical protein CO166_05135 [Candidatus Roizmanbacteria bacterium CG_4_9_14_3_um_filter_36_11]PJC82265.1 MAG: hypothetical protein CO007_00390 [Candidatus Roizmanbacteria bacterium CG_4_8_14_3_um_filter_36_10]PJE61163.1 MAG: hypothetical protein COU86_00
MKKPLFSIIIPTRQINDFLLLENLPALNRQTWRNFEVIVLPNNLPLDYSTLLTCYPWLKIIPTGKISRPAEKRDIGVEKATGEIIVFIDDDAYPEKNWLKNATYLFKTKRFSVLCGPGILPAAANFWERVFDQILVSWIGSGNYCYRFIPMKERFVDDYPSMNFFIKKQVFKKLGGFNSDYWPGEDSKLCEDLVYKRKEKILYSPKLVVYHHRRNNLIAYLKQHANYGFHRGAFFAHGDRNSRRVSYLIPTLFIFYLFFFLLFIIYYLLFRIGFLTSYFLILAFPLLIYSILNFLLIIQSFVNTKKIIVSLVVFPVLFLTHLTYGIIFVKGFFVGKVKKNIYE